MDIKAFRDSLQGPRPPAGSGVQLQALWFEAKGDWQQAHDLIQDLPDAFSARLHAYLHRREGDQPNALYWYRRAGVPAFTGSLVDEWEGMVSDALGRAPGE